MTEGGGKKQLGRILLQRRLVTQEQLDRLLETQRADPSHPRLASIAATQGTVSQVDLLKALSEQHGVPGIELSQVVIPLDNLKLIPRDIARQHGILPVVVKEDQILLVMSDPTDRRIVDEIEFVTGRRVTPYVALHNVLVSLIEDAYGRREKGETHYIGHGVSEEYLRNHGVRREPSISGLGGRREQSVSSARPAETDELGLGTAGVRPSSPSPPLDPAFESRVGPLPQAPTRPSRAGAHPTVLVVDDEDDIRRLLKRVLTERGYRVLEAADGMTALQIVRDRTPDAVLLDAMVPQLHGFEVCRRIKTSKRYGHIHVIMVSAIYRGWRVAEDLRQSYGVDAFIEKPFKIADVLAAIERAIQGGELPSALPPEATSTEAQSALASGIAAFKGGNLDAAIEHLRRGITHDPLAFRLHFHLGLLYGRREESVYEAIQALETAVDLAPRHFGALRNLAILFQRVGFRHKAIEMWERALAAAPDEETRRGIKEHLRNLL